MRLTKLQQFKLQHSYSFTADVLREIKQGGTLHGKDLKDMKVLEEAVGALETLLLIAEVRGPKFTDDQIQEWADLHGLDGSLTELRAAFEDIATR